MELLYATNNPGKLAELSKHLGHAGINVVSPREMGFDLDVDEIGTSLKENAALKVRAYLNLAPNIYVISDDTGLEINGLKGEPGIHVRRWKDHKTRMDDEEIIEYCMERMKHLGANDRSAQFRTVIALGGPNIGVELFDGILKGRILEQPDKLRIPGFPFDSIFFVNDWNKLIGEVHALPAAEKTHLLTHREKAIEKALPRIKELLTTFASQ